MRPLQRCHRIEDYASRRSDTFHDVITEPFKIKDGKIAVPTTPGLGLECDAEKLKRYNAAEVTERPVVVRTPGNSGRAKGPNSIHLITILTAPNCDRWISPLQRWTTPPC